MCLWPAAEKPTSLWSARIKRGFYKSWGLFSSDWGRLEGGRAGLLFWSLMLRRKKRETPPGLGWGPLVVGPPHFPYSSSSSSSPPPAQDDSLTGEGCSFPPAATSAPLSWKTHRVNNKPAPCLQHNYGIITKCRLPPESLLCGRNLLSSRHYGEWW